MRTILVSIFFLICWNASGQDTLSLVTGKTFVVYGLAFQEHAVTFSMMPEQTEITLLPLTRIRRVVFQNGAEKIWFEHPLEDPESGLCTGCAAASSRTQEQCMPRKQVWWYALFSNLRIY